MARSTFFKIIDKLQSTLVKQNIKYYRSIPIEIRVSCVIYKLAHGYNFLICNKLFMIGKSTVSLILHEFVVAFNLTFSKLVSWLKGPEMQKMMEDFKLLCDLPNVHNVINGTHLLIYIKPSIPYPEDNYYHKFGGYSMVAQVVVEFNKRFITTYIDLLRSMNNS
jgi:hypothetical protein